MKTVILFIRNIVFGMGLYLLLTLMSACSSSEEGSPEAQIEAVIGQMVDSAKEKNRRGVTEHISERFSGHGAGSKTDVENIVRGYLLRNANINIWTKIHSITPVTPQEYKVELTAAMAAKGVNLDNETERLKADLHRFQLTFVDIEGNGEWQIEFAEWERGL